MLLACNPRVRRLPREYSWDWVECSGDPVINNPVLVTSLKTNQQTNDLKNLRHKLMTIIYFTEMYEVRTRIGREKVANI